MNLLESRRGRRVLFTALYLCEGAPIGFLWWALPSVLRARGVATDRIGALLGWLVLPWALKWVWAPLIDRRADGRAGLRGWIVVSQTIMALTLAPLLFIEPAERLDLLAPLLIAHALAAATQDAAIDALMIRSTTPDERGSLSGWMQVGMLGGRSLLGGGALLLLDVIGDTALVATLIGVLAGGLALSAAWHEPRGATVPAAPRRGAGLLTSLRAALGRRRTWIGLAFAATAGAGFEALGAFAGPLLTDLSGGATDVAGRFFLVPAVVAAAAGGLLGGGLADRRGARLATGLCGVLIAVTVLATAAALGDADTAAPLLPWLTAVYVAIGGFTAASYALFMEWTDRRLAATQFSAYMGATNLCESWAAAAAGGLIPLFGYGPTLAALALVGAAALGLLPLARAAPAPHDAHAPGVHGPGHG